MNNLDFDKILIETMDHTTIDSFLQYQRKVIYHCKKKEFAQGLKDSLERFYRLISSGSNNHYDDEGNDLTPFLPTGKIERFEAENGSFVIKIDTKSNSYWFDDNTSYGFLERIEKYIQLPDIPTIDYSDLLIELKGYIINIKPKDFSFLILNKALYKNVKKAHWIGRPADAYRFLRHIEIDRPTFNQCFKLENFTELLPKHEQKNRNTKVATRGAINKILDKYLPKK